MFCPRLQQSNLALEARRKSEMVDVGVDVAWESRQVGGYKVCWLFSLV